MRQTAVDFSEQRCAAGRGGKLRVSMSSSTPAAARGTANGNRPPRPSVPTVVRAGVCGLLCAWAFLIPRDCPAGEVRVCVRPGDRIVFLGDSITAAAVRKDGFITRIGEFVRKERPDWKLELIGAGISGNKVPDLQKRLDRDVLSRRPDVVVVYIGINDVWHWNRNAGTPKDAYEVGLRDVVARIQKAGAQVLLCTPSVIGEKTDGSNRFDSMLDEYAAISRKVARELHCGLLDLRRRFLAKLKQINKDNRSKGILTTDGVHLNAAGNRFVAECMLEGLGMKPARLLRHVVMFRFKQTASPEQVQRIVAAFAALPERIEAIHDFEYGTDVSIEGKSQGFTHCFLVTFRSEEDRAEYLPHPAHQEFVKLVGPHVEKVLVFDYWVTKP
ncbi:MAG: hypothetical protein D6725_12175 [Planctomycetota bacterium]|nr:MAG: hypothetical protein D6725_12175 [Planctomycetota bacterium]